MILQRYIARRFILSFLGVLGVFLLMLTLFDLVEQIRRFGSTDATFGAIVRLTLLRVPESLYQILPLIVILATLALFLALARSSELVVTRASGRSAIRSLVAPCIVAGLIGVLGVALVNPLVAATSKRYEQVAGRYLGGDPSTLSISREGLWLRQGGDAGQTVIRASRANLDGTQLFDVTFLGFSTEATARYRIEAAQAELVPGAWAITDAKEWRFDVEGNIEIAAVEMAETSLPSNLTRGQILDSFGTPSAIPIWDMPEFIAQLETAGFSARAHRMFLHMELAMPLLLVAMVLVGAGFTMRHTRSGRTGLMVLMALGLGFALFFIRNFAQVLGENGQIPILLAAWGPPVAAMLLPLGLLLHLEDG
jgi:lipopolysaccharide export system permease protein